MRAGVYSDVRNADSSTSRGVQCVSARPFVVRELRAREAPFLVGLRRAEPIRCEPGERAMRTAVRLRRVASRLGVFRSYRPLFRRARTVPS